MNKNIDVTNDHALEVWHERLTAFRVDLNNLIYFERGPIIHSGGFGDVRKAILLFPAQPPSLDGRPPRRGMGQRPVAVKTLRIDTTTDIDRLEKRIIRETYIWSQLKNEHVLEFLGYHFACRDGRTEALLVCPWLENGESVEYVKQRNLGTLDRLQLLLESAEGLLYLHSHVPPICHGDVKGANILIKDDGHAALSDFGLAQISEEEFGGIASKSVQRGSIRWSSPERVSQDQPAAPPSDVWSWSWLIWEFMTGTLPFSHVNNSGCVVYHIISSKLPRCDEEAAIALVPSLAQLMHQCWQQEPKSRPSMTSCIRMLKQIMEELDPQRPKLPTVEGKTGTLRTSLPFSLPPPHEFGPTLPSPISPIHTARPSIPPKLEPPSVAQRNISSRISSDSSGPSSPRLPAVLASPVSERSTSGSSIVNTIIPARYGTPGDSSPRPHFQQEGLDGITNNPEKEPGSGSTGGSHRQAILSWAKGLLHLPKHETKASLLAPPSTPLPSIPSFPSFTVRQNPSSYPPGSPPVGDSVILREPSLEEPPWKAELEIQLARTNAAQMQLWREQENMRDYLTRLERWLSQSPPFEKPSYEVESSSTVEEILPRIDVRHPLLWTHEGPTGDKQGDQSPPPLSLLPSIPSSTPSDLRSLNFSIRNAPRPLSRCSTPGNAPFHRSTDRIASPIPVPRILSPVHVPSLGPYPIIPEPVSRPLPIVEDLRRPMSPTPVAMSAQVALPPIHGPIPRVQEPIPPPVWFHWREVLEYTRVLDPCEPDANKGILTNTNQEVAIKPLDTPVQESKPGIPKMEVLSEPLGRWTQLNHQNIADVLGGFVRADGIPSVISAWYSNGNISDFLKKNNDVDRELLLYQVAQGLTYLHGQGPAIVHCNLKPNNILIDEDSNSRLGDIGILGFLESSTRGKKLFGRQGDVRWTAPEVLEGGSRTTASDIYAFGCLALVILKDRLPFRHLDSDVSIAKAIYEGELPVSDIEARELHPTWRLCYARNPASRPTMKAVLESLSLW